jgi:hypothetical protein
MSLISAGFISLDSTFKSRSVFVPGPTRTSWDFSSYYLALLKKDYRIYPNLS